MQIHIIGSIVMALISLLIFAFLSYVYWQNIRSIKSYQKYILLGLRSTTLLFVIFLILDPWFQWSKQIEIREKLSIYLDSSSSMKTQLAYDNIEIGVLKTKIDEWSEKNNVENQWYLFGENVREASLRKMGNFSDSLTDFSQLPDHAIINNGGQILIITDGQSNRHLDIKHVDFDEDLKINVIGVGADKMQNDVWIENIIAPSHAFIEDSVKIKITIGYSLYDDLNGELIFNLNKKENFAIPVKIPMGDGFIDFEKTFLAIQVMELNQIEIRSDIAELNFENNSDLIHIQVNEHKKGILLVSSGLSSNTQLIKSMLAQLPPHTLTHLYKKNNIEWSLNLNNVLKDATIQMVVFDDFPGSMNDAQIYDKITINNLWQNPSQLYFEGPKSNASTGELLSEKLGASVRLTDAVNNLKMDSFNELSILKRVELSSIPPSKKQMVWQSSPENIIYGFDDKSAAIIKQNNFYGIFIQDAQEVILSENKNHQSTLKKIFSNLFLHAFTGDENLLKLTSEKQKYMANAPIIFNIEKSPLLENGKTKIYVNDSNGNVVNEILLSAIEKDSPPQFFALSGNYTASAFLIGNSETQIESQPFHFRVIKSVIENDNLFENKNDLENLAWNNGGTYTDPNHLDVVLSTVNSRPKSQLKEYKFSALSTQRYWWILIILLSVEWFLRKREGLL
ncbi:MAG: hypothetical protein H8E72_01005 [Candidatus Marinimicrobia bacterium]|nr:hypothetical protein [Candidatus Neomarinimicrobiota bacterium]